MTKFIKANSIHQGSWIDDKRFVALIVDKEEIDQYTKGLTKEQKEKVYTIVSEKITDRILAGLDGYYDIIKAIINDYKEYIK